jgi:hypothetical protein
MLAFFLIIISGGVLTTAILVNFLLIILAIIGFRNLKMQIRELQNQLSRIKEKQKEIRN